MVGGGRRRGEVEGGERFVRRGGVPVGGSTRPWGLAFWNRTVVAQAAGACCGRVHGGSGVALLVEAHAEVKDWEQH